MTKFHIVDGEVRRCRAYKQPCPYQDFDSRDEAEQENQEYLSHQYSGVLSKSAHSSTPEDVSLSADELMDYVNESEDQFRHVQAMIDKRAQHTPDKLTQALNAPVSSACRQSLLHHMNVYQDRTAEMVEAETESRFYTPQAYALHDDSVIGDARLVSSYEPNSEAWLQNRSQVVGGSDVSALAVVDFAPSSDSVYHERLQQLEYSKAYGLAAPNASGTRGAAYRGTVWEPKVRDGFVHDHPECTVYHAKGQYAHKDRSWQQVNFDGIVESDSAHSILEIKTSGSPHTWDSGVPLSYRAQVLYYLNATGFQQGHVRAQVNDYDTYDYTIDRDEEIVSGSGVTMDHYVRNRVEPWFLTLNR